MKQLVNMSIIFFGLIWFWLIADNPDWYWLFIIIFAGVIFPELLFPPKSKSRDQKYRNKSKENNTKRKKRNLSNEELVATKIENLDGYEFERLVALYFKQKGYEPRIVGGSGDHEVDIILTDPKEKYKIAVQCKHWKTKNVGNDVILRLSAGRQIHKCLFAWCITTSNYTKDAKEAAERLNIRILNGLHVQDEIGRWQKSNQKL